MVAADEEVRRGLHADEAVVAAHDAVVRTFVASLGECDQEEIVDADVARSTAGDMGHGVSLSVGTGVPTSGS